MSSPSVDNVIQLLAIVVLYRTTPDESAAFKTLQEATRHISASQIDIKIFLFDNSPQAHPPSTLADNTQYYAAGYNAGLSTAYNWALDQAESSGSSWLLLLDQDTFLPPDFFESLAPQLQVHDASPEVVAVVPFVRSGGVIISPKSVGFFGLRPLRKPCRRIHGEEIMAINSGTVLRCEFVRSIGGFNCKYWLDYLDHWLFREIHISKKSVYVSHTILDHALSVQNYRHDVSPERYRSILAGESSFIRESKSSAQICLHSVRLLIRTIKLLALRHPDMALMTVRGAFELFSPATRRSQRERG